MEKNPAAVVWHSILLGIIQGLTEFLPVSSSGHLALAQKLIPGFDEPGLLIDVMLHVGTLVAVVIYYRKELMELSMYVLALARGIGSGDSAGGPTTTQQSESKKLLFGIVIATAPTGIIGLLLEDKVEAMADSVTLTGLMLVTTAAILVAGELAAKRVSARTGHPGKVTSFVIGIVQGLAVIPGISRSGATIAAARAMGIEGQEAARFSFLISVPAISGAALLTVVKNLDRIMNFTGAEAVAAVAGPLTAGIIGYLAIGAMMRVMGKGKLWWFAAYCALAGGAAMVYNML